VRRARVSEEPAIGSIEEERQNTNNRDKNIPAWLGGIRAQVDELHAT
jgi:hypothetical protein